MVSRHPRQRRLLLAILLGATLVAEITGLAIARTLMPADAGGGQSATRSVATGSGAGRADPVVVTGGSAASGTSRNAGTTIADPARTRSVAPPVRPPAPLDSIARATTVRGSANTKTHVAAMSTRRTSYHGRNHVWIPSLGINRSVSAFACSRTRPPDNDLYRWGCSGHNNVYLLGHAYSVFKPLHDAYAGGRLRKGMKVVYADGSGTIHTYSVIWWRVVPPTTAASWAWAAQSRPTMTLQTCVGANSQYRLMVRLVQIG